MGRCCMDTPKSTTRPWVSRILQHLSPHNGNVNLTKSTTDLSMQQRRVSPHPEAHRPSSGMSSPKMTSTIISPFLPAVSLIQVTCAFHFERAFWRIECEAHFTRVRMRHLSLVR